MKKQLNELSKEIYAENIEKGFWQEPREIGTLLMLIVSELSEALEADRKDKRANLNKYYQGIAHGDIYETYIKGTFEEEIADTFIRLFDLCGHLNIDIEKHIELKRIYNQSGNFKHDKKY